MFANMPYSTFAFCSNLSRILIWAQIVPEAGISNKSTQKTQVDLRLN